MIRILQPHVAGAAILDRPRGIRLSAGLLLAMLLLAPASAFAADTIYDPPTASPGGIKGVLSGVANVQSVIVVEPIESKAYKARLGPNGSFECPGLPPGEYDLLILSPGRVHEGLTLEPPSDDASGEPPPAPTESELRTICDGCAKTFFASEPFFNAKRIVRLTGSGDRARMFTMMDRTNAVVDPAGNKINASIRRYDLWDLVKTGQHWQIKSNRHLARYEVPHGSPDEKVAFAHSPRLGGILVGQSIKDLGSIDLTKGKLPPSGRAYASREGATP